MVSKTPAKSNFVVAVYATHAGADAAVRALEKHGFDLKNLSIVGKDSHTEERAVGYYTAGDRMKYWGREGAFWGGLWGMLFGSAFFWVPGVGPLLVAGPLVVWMVAALEGAVVGGGLGALGAALASVGVPDDSVVRYETEVRNGRYLLVAHGTAAEIGCARTTLDATGASEVAAHPPRTPAEPARSAT